MSCSGCRRRATPGSCCRRSPASSSIASTSAARSRASSRTYLAKGAGRPENTWNLDGIPDHRSGGHRHLADLLQLRHVPGDERHDWRRFRDQSHRRRAAEHAVQDRLGSRVGRRALLSARARTCRAPTCRTNCCRSPATSGKGNRMKEFTDVGFDVGGPHRARSLVGVGIVRPHRRHAVHAQRRSRSHPAREHRVQDDRPGERTRSARSSSSSAATR